MPVKVDVEFVGVLRELAGKRNVSLELKGSMVVKEVLSQLVKSLSSEFKQALIDPNLNDLRSNVLVLLNHKEIGVLDGLKTQMEDGDKLVLIPVSHGG